MKARNQVGKESDHLKTLSHLFHDIQGLQERNILFLSLLQELRFAQEKTTSPLPDHEEGGAADRGEERHRRRSSSRGLFTYDVR